MKTPPGLRGFEPVLTPPGLMWLGALEVRGTRHALAIEYPYDFPMNQPHVLELDPKRVEVVDDRRTLHQLDSLGLCLFTMGHGRSSWSPEYTVVDVLERYRLFREKALDGGHVAEFYSDDEPVAVHQSGIPRYVAPELAGAMARPGEWGSFRWRKPAHGRLAVVSEVRNGRTGLSCQADLTGWEAASLEVEEEGLWLCAAQDDVAWRSLLPSRRALERLLRGRLPKRQFQTWHRGAPLLLTRRSGLRPVDIVHVHVRQTTSGGEVLPCVDVEPLEVATLEDAIFRRVDGVISGRTRMRELTVIMIGLGSLGSFTALALARAGVSRFVLFDPDRLRVENICRHVGDMRDVGRPKVEVVAERIRLCHPSAKVLALPTSPLADLSLGAALGSSTFLQALRTAGTLVVTTVADDRVERPINRLLIDARVPGIYSSVLGDAEHGRIFRVLPFETACYQCVLHAQAARPDAFPVFEKGPERSMPGVGAYHQPGIPGIGIDVEQVALLTSRFALQTLGRMVEGGIGYPDEQRHHLLWTNRGGWIFDRPLQLEAIHVPRARGCQACGSSADEVPQTADEHARLRAYLRSA